MGDGVFIPRYIKSGKYFKKILDCDECSFYWRASGLDNIYRLGAAAHRCEAQGVSGRSFHKTCPLDKMTALLKTENCEICKKQSGRVFHFYTDGDFCQSVEKCYILCDACVPEIIDKVIKLASEKGWALKLIKELLEERYGAVELRTYRKAGSVALQNTSTKLMQDIKADTKSNYFKISLTEKGWRIGEAVSDATHNM